jgi:hypothetical protein
LRVYFGGDPKFGPVFTLSPFHAFTNVREAAANAGRSFNLVATREDTGPRLREGQAVTSQGLERLDQRQ